ncbi:MAG: DUF2252 family protein [Bacteriovoracaceae bacterium]
MKKEIRYLILVIILCFILSLALNIFWNHKLPKKTLPTLTELQKILDNQDIELIKNRLNAAKDDFSFFRSFVPLYYKVAEEASSNDFPLNVYKYKHYRGIICGDLHPNNLGPIFNDFGDPEITLNDFDDTKEGYYVLDFLRYLVSLKFLESTVSIDALVTAYQKGLNNNSHTISEATLAITGKSKKKGTQLKKEMQEDKFFTDLKNNKVATYLSQAQQDEIVALLSKHFLYPIKIFDAYQTYKIHGGAGGLLRINLLVGPSSDHLQWIELKELKTTLKPEEYKKQVDLLLGNNFKNTFQMIQFQNRLYYLKHHWKGEQTFDIRKTKSSDFQSIVLDQAYIIGQIHLRSMSSANVNIEHYNKLITVIPINDWISSINYIHETFTGFFKQTH